MAGSTYMALRGFVLNRYLTGLPPKLRVHMYLHSGSLPRFDSSPGAMIRMRDSSTKVELANVVYSEISTSPFGFTVADENDQGRALGDLARLCDVTWFARFPYNVLIHSHLWLPILETPGPTMFDYRSASDIGDARLSAL